MIEVSLSCTYTAAEILQIDSDVDLKHVNSVISSILHRRGTRTQMDKDRWTTHIKLSLRQIGHDSNIFYLD